MDKRKKIRGDDPKLGKLKKARDERLITVNNVDYFWKVNGDGVYVRGPSGKRFGTKNSYAFITPYDVKEIILANQAKLV